MKTKLTSPFVWGVVFTTILAQLEILSQSEVNVWTVSMAVCTVIIAFLGALNNPNDKTHF